MTGAGGDLRVYDDIAGVSRAAAEIFLADGIREAGGKGFFTAVLSGGKTPAALYSMLAGDGFRGRVPWGAVHLFWGDERCVPMDDPMSNYGNAAGLLISKVPIPAGNVHRIRTELPAAEAAREYEEEIRAFFVSMADSGADRGGAPSAEHVGAGGGVTPAFDLVFLGLGADGHTLSIFPSTPPMCEKERLVVDSYVERLGSRRITMTMPLINNASRVVFLISGRDKAGALREVLSGGGNLPAEMVRPASGNLVWLVDREAAGLIS